MKIQGSFCIKLGQLLFDTVRSMDLIEKSMNKSLEEYSTILSQVSVASSYKSEDNGDIIDITGL